MANITISDLRPAGYNLFSDSESYMNELSDSELNTTNGGATPAAFLLGVAAGVAGNAAYEGIKKLSNPFNSI